MIKFKCKQRLVHRQTLEIKVKSIAEFVTSVHEKFRNGVYYFRGETKEYTNRIPSLYRNKKLVLEGSEKYYEKLLHEIGYSGIFDNFTLFETFVDLQHHGIPTRVLDITSNPLVALFFACEDADDTGCEDGIVYVYKNNGDVKYSSSHTAAVKTALNLIEQTKINKFLFVMSYLHENIGDMSTQKILLDSRITVLMLIERLSKNLKEHIMDTHYASDEDRAKGKVVFKLQNTIDGKEVDKEGKVRTISKSDKVTEVKKEIVDFLNEFTSDPHYVEYILKRDIEKNNEEYDNNSGFRLDFYQEYLLNELKVFLQDFMEIINQKAKTRERLEYPNAIYKDIVESQIIESSKNHQRIVNQKGLFIFPAFIETKSQDLELIQKKINYSIRQYQVVEDNDLICYRIPKDKKGDILKELRTFGIDDGFIYPDREHIAKALLRKIKED